MPTVAKPLADDAEDSRTLRLGKAGRLGKPRAFHFDASAFWSLGGRREGVKNPMFLKVWSLVSSDTPGTTHGKRGIVKVQGTSGIVLVKFMSSVCALAEEIYKNVNASTSSNTQACHDVARHTFPPVVFLVFLVPLAPFVLLHRI